MLVVSPTMKLNYQRYGHWLGFDLTHHMVQGVNESGRPWRLGVFTGISSSRKIVPFGLALVNQETK